MNLVVLNLESGNFDDGFPQVTARLGKPGNLTMQLRGSLPPARHLPELYGRWQLLYLALYQNTTRADIEIKPEGITQVSEVEFQTIGENLATQINNWLGSEGFREIEQQLRTQLAPYQAIQIIIESDDEQVWRLPWSLWKLVKEDYRYAEIALSTPEYPAPPPLINKKLGAKIKILAIFGNSNGINLQEDLQLLKKLPGVELKLLFEPERDELTAQLWEQGWDFLFFAGHSSSNANATTGNLFINQLPDHNSITIAELQEALHISVSKGLQLAIFNSCDGLGLPRQLAKAKVPLPPIIVMREPVPDPVAPAFLQYFFRAFADGEPFYVAVRQAREQLKGLEHYFPGASWLPVICQHPAITPPSWQEWGNASQSDSAIESRERVWLGIGKRITKFVTLTSLALFVSYLFFGSKLARQMNNIGLEKDNQGQYFLAQGFYGLATLLDLNYATPHYNLAVLCDDVLDDLDCTVEAYQKAALRGSPEAFADVASLYIKKNNPEAALKAVEQCLNQTKYDSVKTSCLKNRAWVRWQKGRVDEALVDLEKAIALEEKSPHAYCLLAQALEAKDRNAEAMKAWRKTWQYSKSSVPEEEECIEKAWQRLNHSN